MAMLTIAQISAVVAAGTLPFIAEQALGDAQMTVALALDPCWIGEEPHLRCVIDRAGFDDAALHALDQAVWAELAARNDALWATCGQQPIFTLKLAA